MEEKYIIEQINEGKVFFYPTDTIYGLGCDATNQDSVQKIKNMKERDKDKPLSVIAPSLKWIKENLIIDEGFDLNKYLPGPYTILLKKKKKDFLNWVSNNEFVGVRIPDNDFTKIIQMSGKPFITTSVNLSGEPFVTSLREIPENILDKIDVFVDFGKLSGRPSTLIMNGKEIKR